MGSLPLANISIKVGPDILAGARFTHPGVNLEVVNECTCMQFYYMSLYRRMLGRDTYQPIIDYFISTMGYNRQILTFSPSILWPITYYSTTQEFWNEILTSQVAAHNGQRIMPVINIWSECQSPVCYYLIHRNTNGLLDACQNWVRSNHSSIPHYHELRWNYHIAKMQRIGICRNWKSLMEALHCLEMWGESAICD